MAFVLTVCERCTCGHILVRGYRNYIKKMQLKCVPVLCFRLNAQGTLRPGFVRVSFCYQHATSSKNARVDKQ